MSSTAGDRRGPFYSMRASGNWTCPFVRQLMLLAHRALHARGASRGSPVAPSPISAAGTAGTALQFLFEDHATHASASPSEWSGSLLRRVIVLQSCASSRGLEMPT